MGKAIRYDESFKKKAVRTYLQGDLSVTTLAKQLGIDRHNFSRWIKEYNYGVVMTPITGCDALQALNASPKHTLKNRQEKDSLYLQTIYDKVLELESELLTLKDKLNTIKIS